MINESATVLIVEDEQDIRELLAYNLEKEGYATLQAADGKEGLDMARARKPDLILLDLMLPKLDGLAVCRELERDAATVRIPIIMLTARGEDVDRILGFELGADDYVVKPFELEVLYSRVRALLRRTREVSGRYLSCGSISLDKKAMAVFYQGEEISVSQAEYQILLLLMTNKGKTVTRESLLLQVWDKNGNYVNDNTLTVVIKRLREKLHQPSCLKTIRSFGYRMEEDAWIQE